jgi:putative transposase
LWNHGGEPRKIVTDKLRSYGAARRELIPEVIHSTEQYANNRAEQSHESTRLRERVMRKFKSVGRERGSWVLTLPSAICSILAGIWCPPTIIGIFVSVRSLNGPELLLNT